MSEIKVGDRIKVNKLLFLDKPNGIIEGETYEVIELVSDGDGVCVKTPTQNKVGLIYEQIEKVEEEEQLSEFKVGDKVRVKWVDEQDKCRDISKGDCFTVLRVDRDGDVRVNLPNGELGCLFKHQVELVENERQVGEFKVGDKVKVISLHSSKDKRYLQIGKTYTVNRVDADGWPLIITGGVLHNMMPSQVEKVEFKVGDKVKVKYLETNGDHEKLNLHDTYEVSVLNDSSFPHINLPNGENHMMYADQIEKVENKTEFTFPQMAQKLIEGEFEEGTELVTDNGSTYFVDRAGYKRTYGLKSSKNGGLVISQISAPDFNATWKVKEQSIKEMSIEEIQKELGYKIKVTE